MPEITPEVVTHLAALSRIALTEEEVGRLTGELGQIVESVATVSKAVDDARARGEDVPATSHPIPLGMVTRADQVGTTLTPDQALSGAPARRDGQFEVASILGEEQ